MIKLSFIELRDRKLEKLVPGYGYLTRLICNTKFKTFNGWTKSHDAIIDTGAHISIIFAYLALDEGMPLILGFKTLLEEVKICFDHKDNEAWLEKL